MTVRARPRLLAFAFLGISLALLAACAATPHDDTADTRARFVLPGMGWGGAGM